MKSSGSPQTGDDASAHAPGSRDAAAGGGLALAEGAGADAAGTSDAGVTGSGRDGAEPPQDGRTRRAMIPAKRESARMANGA